MTRKRKLSEDLDEVWDGGEMEQGLPGETMTEAFKLTHISAPSQAYHDPQATAEGVKDSSHQLEAAAAQSYMCEPNSEVVDNPDELTHQPSVNHSNLGKPKKRMSSEARLKSISINCEWNMCTSVFVKVETFIAHITDHLRAIAGL